MDREHLGTRIDLLNLTYSDSPKTLKALNEMEGLFKRYEDSNEDKGPSIKDYFHFWKEVYTLIMSRSSLKEVEKSVEEAVEGANNTVYGVVDFLGDPADQTDEGRNGQSLIKEIEHRIAIQKSIGDSQEFRFLQAIKDRLNR